MHAHTCAHAYICTNVVRVRQVWIDVLRCVRVCCMCVCEHAYMQTFVHIYTHTHTLSHTHLHTHLHTHTHTHTHMHTGKERCLLRNEGVDGPDDCPHERSAEHIARHPGGAAEGQVSKKNGNG